MKIGLRQRVALVGVMLVSALVAFQAARRPAVAPASVSLTGYLPAGALLCLEAQDFGGLLDQWNRSGTKARWLASDNYRVYGNSNLFTKLGDLYGQYGAVAGVTPDLPGLRSMAGRESALALYRIREGEFVFITKLPAAAAARSALGAKRTSYAKRESAGLPFSVKLGDKTVAIAIAKGYFLVATREDLMAQALALLAGGQAGGAAVSGESWYQKASTAAGGTPGLLRLSLDLQRVTATDGFRSYWVQRNGKDLAQFGAGVADVFRTANQIREERVLVRTEEAPRGVATQIGELARYVPAAGCGYCQLRAAPSAEEVVTRWSEKLLEPQADTAAAPLGEDGDVAPPGADFENSIETAPPPKGRVGADLTGLGKLLADNPAVAMLTSQQHGLAPDRVLVKMPVTVAVYGTRDWDSEAVRRAVTQATGIGWRPATANRPGVWVQEGFGRLAVSVQGRLLAIGTDAAQLQSLSLQTTSAADQTASSWTRLAVAQELPLYTRLTKALEPANAEPPFFSANLLSLVRAFGPLQTVTVVERESARERRETVIYAWR